MKAKTLLPSVLTVLAAATGTSLTAPAADLTVPYGTSTNITANATFDTVTVNGDLVVAQGVTLTATKFFVGKNNGNNRATVTLQNGAKISMPSWSNGDNDIRCEIAYSSPATITMLTNSVFTTSEIRIGRGKAFNNLVDIPAKFILHDASISFVGTNASSPDFQTRANENMSNANSYDKSQPLVLLELHGVDSVINPRAVVLGSGDMTIRFAGGRVLFDKEYNYGNTALVRVGNWANANPATLLLESVDGAPIRFDAKSTIEGNRKWSLFDNMNHETDTIASSGSGSFQLEGNAGYRPVIKTSKGVVAFGHSGGFRIADGVTMTLNAPTAAAIANAVNSDFSIAESGTLDLAGVDLSVSGMRSLGTITNSTATSCSVKLSRFDGAGLIGGRALWHRVGSTYDTFTAPDGRTYSNLASFTHETRYVFTNDVELASTALDTTPHGFFAYGGDDYNYTCVVYDGWIWNRSGSTETWTFAGGIGTHTTLLFDDDEKYWFQTYTEGKKATFNVTPGPHHLQIRSYGKTTTGGTGGLSGANFAGWSWTENSVGAGVRLDRNGRDSTNIADYEKIEEMGDGSLLTISPDGSGSLFRPAHSFSVLDMAQVSSIDLFGNRVEIGSLTGFGVVTNSNQYFDGTLDVTGTWTVAASDIVAGKGMRVFGAIEWDANATLAVNGAASLPYDTDYAILVAGVSMSGVPTVAEDPIGKAKLKLSLSADGRTLILSRTRAATVISMR